MIVSHRVQLGCLIVVIFSAMADKTKSVHTQNIALPSRMLQEWITVTELSQKRPDIKGVQHMKKMSDGSHIPESTMISVRDIQTRPFLVLKGFYTELVLVSSL